MRKGKKRTRHEKKEPHKRRAKNSQEQKDKEELEPDAPMARTTAAWNDGGRARQPSDGGVGCYGEIAGVSAVVKGRRSNGGDGGDECIPRLEGVLLGLSG